MAGCQPVIRIIPRLDIKGQYLIKGVHLEGLRKVGSPHDFATQYYQQGADELIYMDAVATLYGRNSLTDIIKQTVKSVFIPITVGGGIRSVDDAKEVLRSGADKVAINTAATQQPELINKMAHKFGRQSVVLSVEAKMTNDGSWEVYTDNGREKTGRNVIDWVSEAAERGAGEVLLTSVDREGTRQGYDQQLLASVKNAIDIPIIASGGFKDWQDAQLAIKNGAHALSMADVLHFKRTDIHTIKSELREQGYILRKTPMNTGNQHE
ncbi:imidazole glycerol phosphate synthase subunit HisF [Thalassotalea fusca]